MMMTSRFEDRAMNHSVAAGICYIASMALVSIAAFMASIPAGLVVMAICLTITGVALAGAHED
jgi:hypothetical protein